MRLSLPFVHGFQPCGYVRGCPPNLLPENFFLKSLPTDKYVKYFSRDLENKFYLVYARLLYLQDMFENLSWMHQKGFLLGGIECLYQKEGIRKDIYCKECSDKSLWCEECIGKDF